MKLHFEVADLSLKNPPSESAKMNSVATLSAERIEFNQ